MIVYQIGQCVVARQMMLYLMQHCFRLRELLHRRLQIGRTCLFNLEAAAQLGFLCLEVRQHIALVADDQIPGQQQNKQADDRGGSGLYRRRPVAGIVEIEILEIDRLAHGLPPATAAPASAASSCFCSGLVMRTFSLNSNGSALLSPLASMIVRSGVPIQSDASRLRM